MNADLFHPIIERWFHSHFAQPTEPQRLGWPEIMAGRNTLIAAPTGSGKTLAAFLVCIDRLLRQGVEGSLKDETQIVYVSPLKALSNDVRRNLQWPLQEIREMASSGGVELPELRVLVRSGDTPAKERQAMTRRPPHIVVTTPESLYIMLTAAKGRDMLRTTRTVIVDEIHAIARDKRGSHLALSLERLAALCQARPVRIGLSATVRPIDEIAAFLVGARRPCDSPMPHIVLSEPAVAVARGEPAVVVARGEPAGVSRRIESSEPNAPGADALRLAGNSADALPLAGNLSNPERDAMCKATTGTDSPCTIVDVGHVRELDIGIEVPPSELGAVCTHEQWAEVYARLNELIGSHRSTLIFVNTRRLAERVAHNLRQQLGEDSVAAHHGSLSREIRLDAEERLKSGRLKAIVATASLELGIDIGFIDLVCQIGSPRSIATFLQRVGRAGHSLSRVPKGRLFPLTRDELVECLSLIRAVRARRLDAVQLPAGPLDILAQQIVAAVAAEDFALQGLYELVRRAWPYRELSRTDFDAVIEMLSDGFVTARRRGAYLHRDQVNGRIRARRGARIAAITSGGAIPETGDYRVVTESDRTFVGSVNEDFAIESMAGDIFILGNTSWRIAHVRAGEVVVNDAQGAPATIPFWLGEAPARTVELSEELSMLRAEVARRVKEEARKQPAVESTVPPTAVVLASNPPFPFPDTVEWLRTECAIDEWPARQAVSYIAAQQAAIGLVPTQKQIVFERFFDESGGMQLVIHAPFGGRINRAWGLALRKRFCRSFDFELQAAANDNGIVLSLGPQHSFPVEQMFQMLRPDNGEHLLTQALLAVPMFGTRWRWNITRSLAVLRMHGGKRVPAYLQRFRADDLLTAVFPAQTACLENRPEDIAIPDHPIVRQTVRDCLHEAMDLNRWLGLLADIAAGKSELVARDTYEASPFSHEILNSNPYTFLDDAPLEERRARAVSTRRSFTVDSIRDLGRLDPEAIAQVRTQAWPTVRDADELHDALLLMAVLPASEGAPWFAWFEELVAAGRATVLRRADRPALWVATERRALVQHAFPDASFEPSLPAEALPSLDGAVAELEHSPAAAWVALVRGRLECLGPVTVSRIVADLGLDAAAVQSALEALEGEGFALRGRFTERSADSAEIEWCERRLLARIHRLTLEGLRQQIRPVDVADFVQFLLDHQHLTERTRLQGPRALVQVIEQLQGFEIPAGAWEYELLPARIGEYDPHWLDELSLGGHVAWGRLAPRRKAENSAPSRSGLTRVVPIALAFREDMAWLAPPSDHPDRGVPLRAGAQSVLDALTARGALFAADLQATTGLLPTHLEDALGELAALGLVTADGFAAIRGIVSRGRPQHWGGQRSSGTRRLARWGRLASRSHSTGGRWSLFVRPPVAARPDERAERWAWQLLHRYGVVFRDLLARESLAPRWREILPMFRRLEARGEIRGGRFVAGVAGEQFALPGAVDQLRRVRDENETQTGSQDRAKSQGTSVCQPFGVISACDPVNVFGIVTAGPRIAATRRNRLAVRAGRLVASLEAGVVSFHEELPTGTAEEIQRQLRQSASSRIRHGQAPGIGSSVQGAPT